MPLQFEIFDAESGAFSYPEARFEGLLAEFDELLDAHHSGQLAAKHYLAALEQLLAAAPDFVDVHAHIACHWHREGKPKKALDAALAGLRIANSLIPEGFDGRIEWLHLDNRPYLRAMHIALLCHIRLRRHRDAVTLVELMLARNPNDNQGVRYLLGSEALRAGDHALARRVCAAEADTYPAYFYELALSHILNDEWVAAATALRRGFAGNAYIAETLGGDPHPAALSIWHGTGWAEPEAASDYLRMYGALWHQKAGARAFARWLFNHPAVLAERAAIMACKEAMLWEAEPAARTGIIARERQLTDAIDDDLSAAIVIRRRTLRGQTVWPWAPQSGL